MSQNPELLSPERLADIRTAADAIPEWVTACDNVESLMQGGELHPAIVHRARLLAHLDAREAQVREVLAGLFTKAFEGERIQIADVRRVATTLGITL